MVMFEYGLFVDEDVFDVFGVQCWVCECCVIDYVCWIEYDEIGVVIDCELFVLCDVELFGCEVCYFVYGGFQWEQVVFVGEFVEYLWECVL